MYFVTFLISLKVVFHFRLQQRISGNCFNYQIFYFILRNIIWSQILQCEDLLLFCFIHL